MAVGTVKSFYTTTHYGFIRPDSGGKDVFVHSSELQRSGLSHLRKGQKVRFEIANVKGKPCARNVQLDGRMTDAERVASNSKEGQPKFVPGEQGSIMERKSTTRDELQSVIAKAVRNSNAQCESFVGILLEQIVPKSHGDVNWTVKGVKYGKGDRTQCDMAISDIVEQLKREFVISDET